MSKKEKKTERLPVLTPRYKTYDVPTALLKRPEFLQKEFKESRAEKLLADFQLELIGRLIVNHRDGVYWIIDGCHRFYCLQKHGLVGEGYILTCDVFENLTDTEMAAVFMGFANRRVMGAYEKFNVNCIAGHALECDIRRVVEGCHLKIGRDRARGNVSAVSALTKVYALAGAVTLGSVLRVIRDAFDADTTAFDGQIIVGIGYVLHRHDGRVPEQQLISQLSTVSQGARGLLRRAEAQHDRTGNIKALCVAAAVVEVFNRGKRGNDKLPPWWKSEQAES